jgi:arogenate dehydrogenase (NADP+)
VKIGVAGLGLIGGSLALALSSKHQVIGFDVARDARDAARSAGIAMSESLEGLLPADVVIVATPLDVVLPTIVALEPRAKDAVLIDVGSVRARVDAHAAARSSGPRIVGMHPMAGRSSHGFAAADPAILVGRPFLIVPTQRSDAHAMTIAGDIARDAGGVVTVCSGAEHDRRIAVLSALPLAIAAALSETGAGDAGDVAGLAGPGYRDTTRLALTSVDLGTAILGTNGANVLQALSRFREVLDEVERAVASGDARALSALLERARSARERLEDRQT